VERKGIKMRAERLMVEPFEFINYLELECTKELNEHGVIKITGLIREENSQKYLNMAAKEIWVNVNAISENEEITRFFSGILTEIKIRKERQGCVLTIEIVTGSFLLDIEPHIRSFQSADFKYSEVIDICMVSADGICSMQEKKEEKINNLLLQYEETDWEFIKRLASYAGTVLLPDDSIQGKRVCWGYRRTNIIKKLQTDNYEVIQDYENYKTKKVLGADIHYKDMISYVVCSREIYNLGEEVQIDGMNLVVGKIVSRLEGQELYHEYLLITKANGINKPIYNHKISGVSLKALVVSVEKTMVKVQIEKDENKDKCRECWLDYATVYSTPDGTGWYCMPEIADEVRVVMPDYKEEHAYVASSIHLGSDGGRTNPNEKSWKNRQKKEVLFTPESIILQNNKGMMIELSDQRGISIISDKDIIVRSDGDIQIKSNEAEVKLSAANELLMQQGTARIQLDNEINIGGGKIYMN